MPLAPHNQFTDVAAVYDDLMSVVPYSYWVDYVETLWERFGAAPRSVLDLACGTGNVLLELQERGYEVAGVDNSAAMLEEARRKAGPAVPLFCQDVRHLELGRTFDAAVCLFDSLNYLLGDGDLQAASAAVRQHLVPGGTFTFDMNSVRALEIGMFDQRGTGRDARLQYVWKSEYDPGTRLCRIAMEFTLQGPEGTRVFHETHVQRGYTQTEILAALEAAGLDLLGRFDAFSLEPPTARSDRYHFIAHRPSG
jgi:SAM-dependent methyltransferase